MFDANGGEGGHLGKGMYGLMYWENDSDDSNFTLRRAVWDGVMGYK